MMGHWVGKISLCWQKSGEKIEKIQKSPTNTWFFREQINIWGVKMLEINRFY